MAVLYMPEIPVLEAERDKLKNQNSVLLKQIQELKFNLSNSDKTPDSIKCTNTVKSDIAGIISAREKEIKEREKIIVLKENTIVTCEKELKLKDIKIANLQSQLKTTERKSSDLQAESVKLQQTFTAFEDKIFALEAKNAELLKNILKEQKDRYDLKHKFDTLNSERNILAAKIKDLEAPNVNLSEKSTADVISQSPVTNSTESVCSFKTTSSSIHDKNVLKKKSVKPQTVKSSQIRPSNLFYDKSVDGSTYFYIKSLGKSSKKNQMVWRVKSSSDDEKIKDKAFNSTSKAKKNRTHKGPKYQWVPKPVKSVSQVPQDSDFKVKEQWLLNTSV
ncbi:hypothetical protein L6452_02413 [Arctium lappa]|uniref:Uncharacterized protein n=1 Tax=Arctium lappa TaxID=4217 RepID=A0ACB9FK02_ARCLA|nr:hypothetical protein L6452_02413 [Arctium lappa]